MEITTDSAVSDTEAVDQVDRQHMIENYVDKIIRRLIERPFDPAPQLSQGDTGRPAPVPGGRVAPAWRTDNIPSDVPPHECNPAISAE